MTDPIATENDPFSEAIRHDAFCASLRASCDCSQSRPMLGAPPNALPPRAATRALDDDPAQKDA